jgi:hypothetical protein
MTAGAGAVLAVLARPDKADRKRPQPKAVIRRLAGLIGCFVTLGPVSNPSREHLPRKDPLTITTRRIRWILSFYGEGCLFVPVDRIGQKC